MRPQIILLAPFLSVAVSWLVGLVESKWTRYTCIGWVYIQAVLLFAGFSWQIHAAALKTVQAFVDKLQDTPSGLSSESQSLVNELVPGMPCTEQLSATVASLMSDMASGLPTAILRAASHGIVALQA